MNDISRHSAHWSIVFTVNNDVVTHLSNRKMMKKIALSGTVCLFILAACQTNGSPPENRAALNRSSEKVQIGPDGHNARVSLDYEGRYEVGKPVTGNDIREIQIKSGQRYVVTLANGINVSGLYSWDASGNRIVLDIRGDPCPFFVGENFLKLEGNGKQKGWVFQKFD